MTWGRGRLLPFHLRSFSPALAVCRQNPRLSGSLALLATRRCSRPSACPTSWRRCQKWIRKESKVSRHPRPLRVKSYHRRKCSQTLPSHRPRLQPCCSFLPPPLPWLPLWSPRQCRAFGPTSKQSPLPFRPCRLRFLSSCPFSFRGWSDINFLSARRVAVRSE